MTQPYLVPDLLAPGLRLVFCGTAPSRASAAAGAYYAKAGNRFWPTLAKIALTPRLFSPKEYPSLLPLSIGLTDLCKDHSGVDAEIPESAFDRAAFVRKMRRARPDLIAFTSKNAARIYFGRAQVSSIAYGRQAETLANATLFVLPSPSGLATRYFDIIHWQALADAFFDRPGQPT